ncbi:MAG: hypothetical protein R3C19_01455 [Planctomycetaceae bacterium]
MTGGRGRGWRGGAAPRRDKDETAGRSWRRSGRRAAAAPGSSGPSRKRLARLGLGVILLAVFVGAGIYLWNLNVPVHTHFVTIDLLRETPQFSYSSAPGFPADKARGFSASEISSSHPAELSFAAQPDSADSSAIDNAHVIVVYVNLLAVAGRDSAQFCVVGNGSPDLRVGSDFQNLATLKESLSSRPKQHKLLLLDLETEPDWRLGTVGSDITRQLRTWPDDIDNLVVVASSSDGATNWKAGSLEDGRTVFGSIVRRAFTLQADQAAESKAKGDGHLTVAEFCRFVQSETDAWVRGHRSVAGQQVAIFPPLESLDVQDDRKNFIVMKNLPPALEASTGSLDETLTKRMMSLWQQREALAARSAILWDPMRWRSATESLLSAQRNLLDGQTKPAGTALDVAEGQLKLLEQSSPAVDEIAATRGLRADWFRGLPAEQRLRNLWKSEADGASDLSSAEDVLTSQLQSYPFQQAGVAAPSSEEQQTAAGVRVRAENAVAEAFGIEQNIGPMITDADNLLLTSEDLLFVNSAVAADEPSSQPPRATRQQNADAFFSALQARAEARQKALTTLSFALDDITALARYAAAVRDELPKTTRESFLDVLEPGSASELPVRAADDGPLPAATVQLIRDTEKLLPLLAGDKSAQPGSLNDVGVLTQQLQDAERELSRSHANATRVATELIATCISDGNAGKSFPAELPAKLSLRNRARRLLDLTMSSVEQRRDLMSIVTGLDGEVATSAAAAEGSPARESVADESSDNDAAAWNAAWMLQTHSLLAAVSGDTARLDRLRAAYRDLRTATQPDHEQRATLAGLVREHWMEVRDKRLATAVAGTGSLADRRRKLDVADVESRLLISGYDVTFLLESSDSPTVLANQIRRFQYCVMNADRSIQSRWLQPDDGDKPGEQHWYFRRTESWLSAADQLASNLRTPAQGGIAELMSKQIEDLRDRLRNVVALRFDSAGPAEELILGEAPQQRLSASINVNGRNDQSVHGIAAVRVLSQSPFVGVDQNSQAVSVPMSSQTATRNMMVRILTSPGSDGCGPVPLEADVFFRGEVWSGSPFRANPCLPNQRTIRLVRHADTGSVVIDGKDVRPIMFVVDWSGSMNFSGAGRQITALNTLTRILGTLQDDDRAGLIVYGHRVNGAGQPNPDYPEFFGRPVPPNLRDRDDVEVLIEPARLTNETRQKFRMVIDDQLRKVRPWGSTPLGLGLTRAANGFASGESGLVIAITDGAASDIGDAAELKRARIISADDDALPSITTANRKTLGELQDAYRDDLHTAVVVALDLKGRENELIQLRSVFETGLNFPIVNAENNQEQLFDRITSALDPREYQITGSSPPFSRSARLGTAIEGIPSGEFSVTFSDMKLGNLTLRGGDNFRLQPDWKQGKIKIWRQQPPLFATARRSAADEAVQDSPTKLRAMSKIRLTDVQDGFGTAAVTIMLDNDDVYRPVRQPAEIQFDVHAAGLPDFRPDQFTQTFTYEQGGPGWVLQMTPWPKDRGIGISAHWKMQRTVPNDFLSLTDVLKADGREHAIEFGGTGNGLPKMLVWSSRQGGGGVLQIGVGLPPGTVPAGQQPHHDMRIEIGKLDALDRPERFEPLNWTKTITVVENGAVENAFSVEGSLDSLGTLYVAFTSAESLQRDASELVSPLNIDQFDR